MILRLLKGRGMISGLFERKWDAIPPHPAPPKALSIKENTTYQAYKKTLNDTILNKSALT
jgi:hypothetical protein